MEGYFINTWKIDARGIMYGRYTLDFADWDAAKEAYDELVHDGFCCSMWRAHRVAFHRT